MGITAIECVATRGPGLQRKNVTPRQTQAGSAHRTPLNRSRHVQIRIRCKEQRWGRHRIELQAEQSQVLVDTAMQSYIHTYKWTDDQA